MTELILNKSLSELKLFLDVEIYLQLDTIEEPR